MNIIENLRASDSINETLTVREIILDMISEGSDWVSIKAWIDEQFADIEHEFITTYARHIFFVVKGV